MKQANLFEKQASDRRGSGKLGALTTLGVAGSSASLSKAQKQFNKLLATIDAQRSQLRLWQDFIPDYQQRVAGEFQPLYVHLRAKKIEMANLLDAAMDGKSLGKAQREKVAPLLCNLLSELLSEAEEESLVEMYNKYSELSFADEQQDQADLIRAMASNVFDIDLDNEDVLISPDALAELIAQKLSGADRDEAAAPKRSSKASAKAAAKEAMREQAAHGASQAIREVFRKLVSELHPDRETDPVQRARKTELIQKVNQAYEADDLLTLLELQLSIEQIDPAKLASMAEGKLLHYNQVLKEQSLRLLEKIDEIIAPLKNAVRGTVWREFTPAVVLRAMDVDKRELRAGIEALETQLVEFRDLRNLKQSLRNIRLRSFDEGNEWNMLDSIVADSVRPRRRARR